MKLITKALYTKNEPGSEKRGEPSSRPRPYVYKKYGSISRLNFGPVTRKPETSLHTSGICLIVKMFWGRKTTQ